jgi:hypothetical protein
MKLKKHILVTSLGVTMSLLTVASTGCDAIGAAKDFVVDGYNKVEDFVGDLLGKDPVENPNENPNEKSERRSERSRWRRFDFFRLDGDSRKSK